MDIVQVLSGDCDIINLNPQFKAINITLQFISDSFNNKHKLDE